MTITTLSMSSFTVLQSLNPLVSLFAEAMGSGCLVVGSDSGGVRDILKNQKTGLSFNASGPDAVDELAVILSRIFSAFLEYKTEDLKMLAESGRTYISEEYSQERMLSEIEAIYQSL